MDSSTDGWAVGQYYNGTSMQPLAEHYSSGVWSVSTLPPISVVIGGTTYTGSDGYLYGVDAISSNDVWVAGAFTDSASVSGKHPNLPYVLFYNGSSWTQESANCPSVGTSKSCVLLGVWGNGSSNVWVTGWYQEAAGEDGGIMENWNSSTWTEYAPTPAVNPTQNHILTGISGDTSGDVWGIGYNSSSTYSYGVEWNNGSSTLSEISGIQNPNAVTEPQAVSVISSSDVWIAGYQGSTAQTLVENFNGSAWSVISTVNPGGSAVVNQFNAIAASSNGVFAAGWYSNGTVNQTLVEQYNGSSFTQSTTQNPSGSAATNMFEGATIDSSGDEWAVGCQGSTSSCAISTTPTTGQTTLTEELTGTSSVCSGGTLSLTAPSTVTFPGVALSGLQQTTSSNVTFTANDMTGSGAGWNIAGTSTTFTNGSGNTLPTTATSVTAGTATAATGNCNLPVNTIAYPVTLPAGSSPPTAAVVYDANSGSGEGPSNVTLTFQLNIPAGALPGSYSSTWTFTISSGP
ncbi:MAG: hypothetical protein ACP5OR_07965 [Candidatus Dormibacteria bacterium]